MANTELRFRIPPTIDAELRARDCEVDRTGQWARKDSAGAVARRDLARYYTMLADELRQLDLTEAEASLICDANNGVGILSLVDDPGPKSGGNHGRAMLLSNTSDSIALNGYDRKHGLTEQQATSLLERMRRWTPGQVLAVFDAVERFWAQPEGTTVRSVGLVR